MILMAVDLGDARTGVACCDPDERMAFPREVVVEYNAARRVQRLAEIAAACGAERIVVGHPKNMDGSAGPRAALCAETAAALGEATGLPVELWDERCTTVLAHRALSDAQVGGKKRKATVDAVAATLILESYLSFRHTRAKTESDPTLPGAAPKSDAAPKPDAE